MRFGVVEFWTPAMETVAVIKISRNNFVGKASVWRGVAATEKCRRINTHYQGIFGTCPPFSPLAQEVRLKPTRHCAKRMGKDYPAIEKAENKGDHITPEREFVNMPPKGVW
jgi:hypothetical protein